MKTKLNLKNTKGMTLIELTVVILVLLSLISVLFIGARSWKDGSDKANCVMNIRNFQTAARSMSNLKPDDYASTATVDKAAVYTFMGITVLNCPKSKTDTYTASGTYGADVGTAFLACSNTTTDGDAHAPSDSQKAQW